MNIPPVLKVISTLRRLSIILLVTLVVLLGLDIIFSLSHGGKSPDRLDLDSSFFVEKKEKIQFQELREGQKEHLRVRAEKHYLGEKGLFHLEGNVEIVFPRRQKGEDVIIRAESLLYDQEFNHFWSTRPAQVEWGEMKIEAERVDYYAPEKVFEGKGKVKVRSGQWTLEADFFQFNLRSRKMVSQGRVSFQLASFLGGSRSLILKTQRFTYDRRTKIGAGSGEVTLQHGASQGKAGEVTFKLGAEEGFIKWLNLKNGVEAQLQDEWGKGQSLFQSGLSAWFYLFSQEIKADSIDIEIFAQTKTLKKIEIRGGARLAFFSEASDYSQLQAEKIKAFWTQNRSIKKVIAEESVSFIRKGGETQDLFIGGEKLEIWGPKQMISVSPGPQEKAFFKSPTLEFKAGKIEIKTQEGDLQGRDGVEATLERALEQAESSPPPGFFDLQKTCFLTCQEMRRKAEGRRLIVSGKVKIWQGDRVLKAEKVILNPISSQLEAKGQVEVNMVEVKPSQGDQHFRIQGESMRFDPGASLLEFEQDIALEMGEVAIKCLRLLVFLDPETRQLVKFEALDQVQVSYQKVTAAAQKAEYQFTQQVLIMSGQPLLEDPSRGKIRGDKLTFHLPDDRIVIENEGEERSILLIKS